MHRINKNLEAMADADVFTTLDLKNGNQKLVMHPNQSHQRLPVPGWTFQWKVLPLRMKTAGAVFQSIMYKVIGDLQSWCTLVYINDITMYSPSLQQHVVDIEAVFARLEVAKLKISVSRNRLVMPKILVLGHSVSALGIRPHPH